MTQVRPSVWHCLWGLPFLLIGGGFFVYTLIHGITHITDSLTQIVVPGSAELSLRGGQDYTVFLEDQSTVNGKIYSATQPISGLTCHVSSVGKGTTIALEKPSASTSYSTSSRSGHSVLEFPVHEDGRYLFSCDYGDNPKGPETVVAVGTGVGEAISRTVFGSLASAFGGGGLGVIVILIVLIKREREKKRIWLSSLTQVQRPSSSSS